MLAQPFSYRRPAARDSNGNSIDDAAPGNVKRLVRHLIQRQTGHPRAKTSRYAFGNFATALSGVRRCRAHGLHSATQTPPRPVHQSENTLRTRLILGS